MAKSGTKQEANPEQARRTERRAEALRANLHRRKAQARGRADAPKKQDGPEED